MLVFPPTNHFEKGRSHSSTLVHFSNQCSSEAMSLQKASGSSMETVVGDVGLSTHEPLRKRKVPFEHFGPLFKPVQLRSNVAPEGVRFVDGAFANRFVLLVAFDGGFSGKVF